MDGENNAQPDQQPVPQPDQPSAQQMQDGAEAALAQEEAFLEAQVQSLAEVKRRRKE